MKKRTTCNSGGVADYARHRGASSESIYRAIREGRLHDTIVRDGSRISIPDFEAADREWERNTRAKVDAPGSARLSREAAQNRAHVNAAQARKLSALADLAELEIKERASRLIEPKRASEDIKAAFAIVRERVLRVPSDLAQRLPQVTTDQLKLIDGLIREALEEISDENVDENMRRIVERTRRRWR